MKVEFHFSIEENNKENLESIENCSFVLCLDHVEETKDDGDGEDISSNLDRKQALQMLHGGPDNSFNRWFDKTMQVSNKCNYYIIIRR